MRPQTPDSWTTVTVFCNIYVYILGTNLVQTWNKPAQDEPSLTKKYLFPPQGSCGVAQHTTLHYTEFLSQKYLYTKLHHTKLQGVQKTPGSIWRGILLCDTPLKKNKWA